MVGCVRFFVRASSPLHIRKAARKYLSTNEAGDAVIVAGDAISVEMRLFRTMKPFGAVLKGDDVATVAEVAAWLDDCFNTKSTALNPVATYDASVRAELGWALSDPPLAHSATKSARLKQVQLQVTYMSPFARFFQNGEPREMSETARRDVLAAIKLRMAQIPPALAVLWLQAGANASNEGPSGAQFSEHCGTLSEMAESMCDACELKKFAGVLEERQGASDARRLAYLDDQEAPEDTRDDVLSEYLYDEFVTDTTSTAIQAARATSVAIPEILLTCKMDTLHAFVVRYRNRGTSYAHAQVGAGTQLGSVTWNSRSRSQGALLRPSSVTSPAPQCRKTFVVESSSWRFCSASKSVASWLKRTAVRRRPALSLTVVSSFLAEDGSLRRGSSMA